MPNEIKDALTKVVHYLYRDESIDYEVNDCPRNHIFESVHILKMYLENKTESGMCACGCHDIITRPKGCRDCSLNHK